MSQTNIAGKTSASNSRTSLNTAALESSQTHSKNADLLGASGHHPIQSSLSPANTTSNNEHRPGSGTTSTHDTASSPGNINTHNSGYSDGGGVGSLNELGQSSFATQRERKAAQRRIIAEDPEWNLAPVEKLTELCLKIIVANFESKEVVESEHWLYYFKNFKLIFPLFFQNRLA
jgi:hypothetical protein